MQTAKDSVWVVWLVDAIYKEKQCCFKGLGFPSPLSTFYPNLEIFVKVQSGRRSNITQAGQVF